MTVELSRKASRCFAGMFRGCKSRGIIFKPEEDTLMIGKSECEWEWRKTWGELKSKGLIDWSEEDVPCHDGGKMIYVHLTVTDAGHAWRKEDLRKWRERMDELDREETRQGK